MYCSTILLAGNDAWSSFSIRLWSLVLVKGRSYLPDAKQRRGYKNYLWCWRFHLLSDLCMILLLIFFLNWRMWPLGFSFVSDMKKMHITTKAKACKDRLFSVAVHPTTEKVLAMAGDKWGRLGFWDIVSWYPPVISFDKHLVSELSFDWLWQW